MTLEPLQARYDGYADDLLGLPGGVRLDAEIIRGVRGTVGRKVIVVVNRDRHRGLIRTLAVNAVAGVVQWGEGHDTGLQVRRLVKAAAYLRELADEFQQQAEALDENEVIALRRAQGRDQ